MKTERQKKTAAKKAVLTFLRRLIFYFYLTALTAGNSFSMFSRNLSKR